MGARKQHNPDIVLTDIEMPILDGLEMARLICEVSALTQIIITAYIKPEYLLEAVNLQLVQYLIEPISLEKLSKVLDSSERFLKTEVIETEHNLCKEINYDNYKKELIAENNMNYVNLDTEKKLYFGINALLGD